MIRFSGLVLLGASAVPQPIGAAVPQPSEETKAMYVAALSEDAMSEAFKRLEFVNAIGAYCRSLERAFPRNSPAENAWLQEEMGGEPERMLRAADSPEAARRQAEGFILSCTSNARAYGAGGDRPKMLVALALAFNRFQNDAINVSRKSNVDADRFGFRSLRFVTTSLLVAALFEPQPRR